MNPQDMYAINESTYDVASKKWPTLRHQAWQCTKEFLDDVEDKENKSLLDVGCGSGRDLVAAVDAGFNKERCTGIDLSQAMVDSCLEQGFHAHKASFLDLPKISADVVLCIAAFHHLLDEADQKKGAQQLYDVTNDDGLLFVTYWNISDEYIAQNKDKVTIDGPLAKVTIDVDGNKHDRYYYRCDESSFIACFSDAGFSLITAGIEKDNVYFVFQK